MVWAVDQSSDTTEFPQGADVPPTKNPIPLCWNAGTRGLTPTLAKQPGLSWNPCDRYAKISECRAGVEVAPRQLRSLIVLQLHCFFWAELFLLYSGGYCISFNIWWPAKTCMQDLHFSPCISLGIGTHDTLSMKANSNNSCMQSHPSFLQCRSWCAQNTLGAGGHLHLSL